MTISKVNAPAWGVGDKLTSGQVNAFDTKIITALDKTSAGDTLSGLVAMSGAGRLTTTVVQGANANTTYLAGAGNNVIQIANTTITANRVYTLSNSGPPAQFDTISVVMDAPSLGPNNFEITVKSGAGAVLYTIGNLATSDGPWATFMYIGSAWQLFQGSQGSRTQTQTITASGNWTCPLGVTSVILQGCGGGGGGGSGFYFATPATNRGSAGGGGGGGAQLNYVTVPVTPGAVYAVVIGAGGGGGAGGTNTNVGGDGGDTTFGTLAAFKGAQGGNQGWGLNSASVETIAYGGSGTRATNGSGQLYLGSFTVSASAPPTRGAGTGGAGTWLYSNTNLPLGSGIDAAVVTSIGSAYGGLGGQLAGNAVSSYQGGGCGGGGGGGPFASGGAGGFGQNGSATTPSAGTNGTAPAANTGAGGGGGSGNAYGGVANGTSGSGGNGGSGLLQIVWVK